MSITAYKLLSGAAAYINDQVTAGIATWQPYGAPFVNDDGLVVQAVVQGALDTGVAAGSVALANGGTVAVVNSAGANSHPAVATVSGSSLTNVKLAATAAMVDNAQQLTIPITGTYATKITLTVAAGVVTAGVLS